MHCAATRLGLICERLLQYLIVLGESAVGKTAYDTDHGNDQRKDSKPTKKLKNVQ